MGKELTKDQLMEIRFELDKETTEAQTALAEAKYTIDLENMQNINALLKQIDKTYKWTMKNAALLINLYDNLKTAKVAITVTEDKSHVVEISALNLNTLYQVLTSIEGTGIEAAKTFTRLLANVGTQISTAMELMTASNRKIHEMHSQLGELDAKIKELSSETVSADEIN
jgi:hypothetical protein